MRPQSRTRTATLLAALIAAASAVVACGEKEEPAAEDAFRAAPEESVFPPAGDRTLEELAAATTSSEEIVVSPAAQTFVEGRNRFGFGVFTVDHEQITDAEVAIYAAPGAGGQARGPFTARIESLATEPAFTAQNTAEDPDAAKVVYVSELVLDRTGEWRLVALVRSGDELAAAGMPSIVVPRRDPVPAPGERPPRVHTPTADEVGDVQRIDTRVPPGTMHDHDLAEVLGETPVVLLFATPALCQSRVCGPVVDVAEQVKSEVGGEVAFIHMEIYEDNDPSKGPREQVRAFNLPSEPWLFVIDREGRINSRIEGAFSVADLTDAVRRVTG